MNILKITISISILLLAYVVISNAQNIEPHEFLALRQLSQQIGGYIVWESNRDGDWEIYLMDMSNNNINKLTNNDVSDLNARISDDGKFIAWTRGDVPKQEVWVMSADGSDQRLLVANTAFGAWYNDGKMVIHRGPNNSNTFIYDPETKTEKKIWPLENVKLKANNIHGPMPSRNGKFFTLWAANPTGTWIFSSDGKLQQHIHSGCEGSFAPDDSFVYWVMTAGIFGKANLKGKVQDPLYDIGKVPYGHTYFPRLSKNMDYLIFGSCPNEQHDHNTSDYEIFLMKMDNLKPAWHAPIRLTYNNATDRWPDIFVKPAQPRPDTPLHLMSTNNGQEIRLTWVGARDSENICYRIYKGTEENNTSLIATVKGASYTDNSTDAKATYYYKISAANLAGLESPLSEAISVKTADSQPLTPSSLYTVPDINNQVRLLWAANPELDIKGYNVYRSGKISGSYKKLTSKPVTETVYVDSNLKKDATYYYQVIALDNSGHESRRSEPIFYKHQGRVEDGLLALYTFNEGNGNVVHDLSGVKPDLNLQIKEPDKVLWLKNGVHFAGSTMIVSEGNADKIYSRLKSGQGLSIEVWFSPDNLSQTGPARIVSMSSDPLQRNFTIGQSGNDLAIRLRTSKTDANGIPELDTKKQVLSENVTHVLTTYDGNMKKLYINGKLHSESQELTGDFDTWGDYPLVIGNEFTGDRTWLGKIYMVAIYSKPLSSEDVLHNYQAGVY